MPFVRNVILRNGKEWKSLEMNNEIKVGEFVRTRNGYIRKIVKEFDKNNNCYIVDKPYYNEKISEISKGIVLEEDIAKHSKNIIEVIEVGDYVNGELVVGIYDITDENENIISKKITTPYRIAQYNGLDLNYYIYEQDIKSIVTKEQFKAADYIISKDNW